MDASDLAGELMEHDAFLRRLARGLVGAEGEDLAQDVWARALAQPPAARGELRAWLARVARNLAANRRRGQAHRAEREDRVRRAEAVEGSPTEMEERFELRRALVAALDGLPEPFRETLLLRHFEELSLEEVARRQGVPLATAKSRHLRALERLRGALDRRRGSREAWLAGVLAWLGPRGAVTAGPEARAVPLPRAHVGGLSIQVGGFVLGLLGLAVGAAWWLTSERDVRREPGALALGSDEHAGGSTAGSSEAPASGAREPRASAGPTPLAPEWIRGALHDDAGRAVAEYTVVAEPYWFASFLGVEAPEGRPVRRAVRDAEGRFVLDGLAAGQWDVRAELPDGQTSESVSVTLPGDGTPLALLWIRASALAGVVLDPDGRPVAGARVTCPMGSFGRTDELDATTDGQGRFTLSRVPPGPRTLLASAPGWPRSQGPSVDLAPAERREGLVLQLRPGARLSLLVLDRDGRPEAGRAVRVFGGPLGEPVVSDAAGRCELELLPAGSYALATVVTEEELWAADLDPRLTRPDREELLVRRARVELKEGAHEEVVLGGPPAARIPVGGTIRRAGRAVGGIKVERGTARAFSDAAGRFALASERAGELWLTVVDPSGTRVPFRRDVPESGDEGLELELASGTVAGRVRTPEGEGMPKLRVWMVPEPPAPRFEEAVSAHGKTDERGAFRFAGVPAGRYRLGADGPAFDEGPYAPTSTVLELAEDAHVERDLVLPHAGSLDVTVRDAAGRLCPGAWVVCFDADGARETRRAPRDAFVHLGGLVPGERRLLARNEGEAAALSAPIRVAPGETTTAEIRLAPAPLLSVTVAAADGPPPPCRVRVLDEAGRVLDDLWLNSESFPVPRLEVRLAPDTYLVEARALDGRQARSEVRLGARPEVALELRLEEGDEMRPDIEGR